MVKPLHEQTPVRITAGMAVSALLFALGYLYGSMIDHEKRIIILEQRDFSARDAFAALDHRLERIESKLDQRTTSIGMPYNLGP
jgi:hypothetical protein